MGTGGTPRPRSCRARRERGRPRPVLHARARHAARTASRGGLPITRTRVSRWPCPRSASKHRSTIVTAPSSATSPWKLPLSFLIFDERSLLCWAERYYPAAGSRRSAERDSFTVSRLNGLAPRPVERSRVLPTSTRGRLPSSGLRLCALARPRVENRAGRSCNEGTRRSRRRRDTIVETDRIETICGLDLAFVAFGERAGSATSARRSGRNDPGQNPLDLPRRRRHGGRVVLSGEGTLAGLGRCPFCLAPACRRARADAASSLGRCVIAGTPLGGLSRTCMCRPACRRPSSTTAAAASESERGFQQFRGWGAIPPSCSPAARARAAAPHASAPSAGTLTALEITARLHCCGGCGRASSPAVTDSDLPAVDARLPCTAWPARGANYLIAWDADEPVGHAHIAWKGSGRIPPKFRRAFVLPERRNQCVGSHSPRARNGGNREGHGRDPGSRSVTKSGTAFV